MRHLKQKQHQKHMFLLKKLNISDAETDVSELGITAALDWSSFLLISGNRLSWSLVIICKWCLKTLIVTSLSSQLHPVLRKTFIPPEPLSSLPFFTSWLFSPLFLASYRVEEGTGGSRKWLPWLRYPAITLRCGWECVTPCPGWTSPCRWGTTSLSLTAGSTSR